MTKKDVEVRFSEVGGQELLDATISWAKHHPKNHRTFDDEVDRAIAQLKLFPESGRRALSSRYENARVLMLSDTGHILVYRVQRRIVTILRIYAARAAVDRP